jgi:hypothetical protein
MVTLRAALIVMLSLSPACGGKGQHGGVGAGSGGSAGASGGPATAGTGGGGAAGMGGGGADEPFVPPENPDAIALEACQLEDPCSESYIQEAEAAGYHIWVDGSACLLEALAQRTPGRYLHNTDSTWGNGSTGSEHRLVITADGSVLYARTPYEYVEPFDPDAFRPDPGQRCALKPPAFFEACRDAVLTETPSTDDFYEEDAAWLCLFGDGSQYVPTHLEWFESCETQSPIACD